MNLNDTTVLEAQARSQVATLADLEIKDQQTYDMVVAKRDVVREWLTARDGEFDEARGKAHAAWQGIINLRKTILGPVETKLTALNTAITTYTTRRRNEQLAAEKAQRDETERLERERQDRIKAETTRLENERLEQAAELIDAGAEETAAALLDTPVQVDLPPPVRVAPAPVSDFVQRVQMRDVWSAELLDFDELFEYAYKNKTERQLLFAAIDKNLNQRARDKKDKLALPGVRAVNNPVAVGGAKH